MRKYVLTAGALALAVSTTEAAAFDWQGFRAGMTPREAAAAAAGRGLSLEREPGPAENATIRIIGKDGKPRGFLTLCQGQLARVGGELADLDLTHVARRVDTHARHGEPGLRTMTVNTGDRGLELFWAAGSDEIGLTLMRRGDRHLMQETMADISLWDLCTNMD